VVEYDMKSFVVDLVAGVDKIVIISFVYLLGGVVKKVKKNNKS
jgi:hypothetical protein